MKQAGNDASAILSRLKRKAKTDGEDFSFLLTRYGTERLLYRLSRSAHSKQFILKGGSLFIAWIGNSHRVTRDIDFLRRGSSEHDELTKIIVEVCSEPCPEDAIAFDSGSVKVSTIKAGQLYEGVHAKLTAHLNRTRIPIRIDIGFGDAVTPQPEILEFPTLLELGVEKPKILAYPKYSVVAEKYHAIIALGAVNSRMKDFYDIWLLHRIYSFQPSVLSKAIKNTFKARKTEIQTKVPTAFSADFYDDPRNVQLWESFKSRSLAIENPGSFSEVVKEIERDLAPALDLLSKQP